MYRNRTLQQKVAMSSFTLPVAALLMLLIWLAGGITYSIQGEENTYWETLHESVSVYITDSLLGLICSVIAAYLLVELNNSNALIRIRTRLTTTAYIMLLSAMTFLHPFQKGQFIVICMLLSYHVLLRSYQQFRPEGYIFFSFLFLGAGSIFFCQLLYLIPFYFLCMGLYFRSLTLRSVFAGLLGALLPYVALFTWSYYFKNDLYALPKIWNYLTTFQPIAYSSLNEHQIASLSLVVLLSITGIVHYLRTHFQDKIRIRMTFYFFILMDVLYILMIVLMPQYFNTLIFILLMNSSPLIAHFFALTHTRVTNIFFIVSMILMAILTVYNLWIPSLISF